MILIVDDREENIFSLRKTLESNNLEVDSALSGEEALHKVLKKNYELIILDVQMPGMDGYEVAEALQGSRSSKDIPILFLSAVATDKRFVTRGLTSGAIDYLTKPVDPDILLLKVKNFSRISRQQQELKRVQQQLLVEVAERKKAQESLEQKVEERTHDLSVSNQELEARNIELQQFASVVSHDLQEPLRKIMMFAGLASSALPTDVPQSVPQYLDRVQLAAVRMQGLIQDLLAFSQLSLADLMTTASLNGIISEVLRDLEMNIETKEAQVVVGDLEVIELVPSAIRQVFQNLIGNALKFSRPGITPQIVIEGERIESKALDSPANPEGQWYRITLQDNGIGFDEEFAERIFTIFQRLHSKDEYEGTGIGLAIARKIIEKHNGIIMASSAPNEGATFTIVLPMGRVKQTAANDLI